MWWQQNKKRNTVLAAAFIVLLAFFLRVYKVASYPAGFSLDEISQGYSAYSILKTGKDEWGARVPLAPRAFGDYRSPLYTYLTIPSIFVFGLGKFAIRFPSVLFGTLAVLSTYLFANRLLGDKKLALLSAFFLAISPWHTMLSRGAFEPSLTVFLTTMAIWLFLAGFKRPVLLIFSAFAFGINMFSYFAPRLLMPVIVAVLFWYFRKEIFKEKIINLKRRFVAFIAVFGFFLLLSFITMASGAKTRVSDTAIINPTDNWRELSFLQYEGRVLGLRPEIERIFNNKATYVARQFVRNYLGYFSFEFLFTKGPAEATYGMIPGNGVLYLFELPLILFALYKIFIDKEKFVDKEKKEWLLLALLLLLSALPAALAKGERAANRASSMLPYFQILSAFGFISLAESFKRFAKEKKYRFYRLCLVGTSVVIILSSFIFYFEDYVYHAPVQNAKNMGYGWEEISLFLRNNPQYSKVVVSKKFGEPQIALAYYLGLDPNFIQKESPAWLNYEKMGFSFVDQQPFYKMGKYEFRSFNFPEDKRLWDTLFIGKAEDFAGNPGVIKTIVYYPGQDKEIAFEAVEYEHEEE